MRSRKNEFIKINRIRSRFCCVKEIITTARVRELFRRLSSPVQPFSLWETSLKSAFLTRSRDCSGRTCACHLRYAIFTLPRSWDLEFLNLVPVHDIRSMQVTDLVRTQTRKPRLKNLFPVPVQPIHSRRHRVCTWPWNLKLNSLYALNIFETEILELETKFGPFIF